MDSLTGTPGAANPGLDILIWSRQMRKAALAALSSALVIPGLGQLINQQTRKGLIILAAVLILLVLAIVQLFPLFEAAFDTLIMGSRPEESRWQGGYGPLLIIAAIFAAIWLYSVLDAYLCGRRLESSCPPKKP